MPAGISQGVLSLSCWPADLQVQEEEDGETVTTICHCVYRTLWRLSSAYVHSSSLCCSQQNTFDSLLQSTGRKLPSNSTVRLVSQPAEDLPQRLSYSKAAQRSPDDMDRKQRECDERLIKLEKTSKAYDRQFEEISRDHKSFNLVMYNIPEEGEKAKNRFEAIKTVAKEFDAAVEVAMSEYTVDEETMKTVLPTTIERIGQFTADRTKPRPVRLVFSTLLQKHGFLRMAKALRQAGFRLDDDLTRSQQAERKTLSLDFQDLKIKGYQPYFRDSLLQYYSNNKVHTCAKGKADKVCMNM